MAEILGSRANFLNRGDYELAAPNLGTPEAEREGIAALHPQGGHLMYYVEGLIVWKRSRIGRAEAKDWAIMNERWYVLGNVPRILRHVPRRTRMAGVARQNTRANGENQRHRLVLYRFTYSH